MWKLLRAAVLGPIALLLISACRDRRPLPQPHTVPDPASSVSARATDEASSQGTSVLSAPLRFDGPHTVGRTGARLSQELRRALDEVELPRPATIDDLISIALLETGRRLHFGLGHEQSLHFGVAEREAHCVEYSHLFGAILERLGKRVGVRPKVYVVRSGKARVLGQTVPIRGFDNHDWVLVLTPPSQQQWFVDPALADSGLGWNIAQRVYGKESLPRR